MEGQGGGDAQGVADPKKTLPAEHSGSVMKEHFPDDPVGVVQALP
jgi:hypothetical protein